VKVSNLRADFWSSFRSRIASTPTWRLGEFRHVHGNDAYIEFFEPMGSGFHPRAVFLSKGNELRAELLSQSKVGIAFIDMLLTTSSAWQTVNGSIAEASVTRDRSSAKIQFVWSQAMTANHKMWTLHQDWIAFSLIELKESFGAQIGNWSSA